MKTTTATNTGSSSTMTTPRRNRHARQEEMTTTGSSARRRSSMMMFVIQSVSVFIILLAFQESATSCLASFQPPATRPTRTTRATKMSLLLSTSKTTRTTTPTRRRFGTRRTLQQQLSSTPADDRDNLNDDNDNDNDDDDDNTSLIDGPEKSLMTNYISQFLLREAAAQQQQQQQEQQEESPMSVMSSSAAAAEKSTDTEESSSSSSSSDDDDNDDDESMYYTHLVAIPMDNCHELLLELESIQRAILYHCPVLVHACIPQAITRLPLLYVRCCARATSSSSSSSSLSSSSSTKRLGDMVQEVIQKHGLFLQNNKQNSTFTEKKQQQHVNGKAAVEYNVHSVEEDLPSDFNRRVVKSTDDNDDTIKRIQPLMLNFSTLEVDGNTNQVLQTVAKETDASTRILQQMVHDLQHLIQQQEPTWETMLPPDPHHHTTSSSSTTASSSTDQHNVAVFRPRIPFMRLPRDWDEIIRQQYKREVQKQLQEKNPGSMTVFNSDNDDDDDDDDQVFLTSDQGGNGISPIFWCQWWHDEFPESRMREVAIYRRQQQKLQPNAAVLAERGGLNEQTFYMPEKSIPLPLGNDALTKQENKFQDYQEQRMLEAEALQAQQQPNDDDDDYNDIIIQQEKQQQQQQQDENDPLFVKTRNRLESLYQQSSSSWDDSSMMPPINDNAQESETRMDSQVVDRNNNDSDRDESSPLPEKQQPAKPKTASDDGEKDSSSSSSVLDDWTLERIRRTVASRAKVQSEKELARKKDNLPPIAENNVFTKYKEGTLVPEQDQIKQELSTTSTTPRGELPPFPSREHCLGFWRVLKSPTGFDVEEEEDDPTRSDNLVLCVDGTIAGGPILDQETRQKASGGTWRLSATSIHDATLRIRLVIPPKKDRILVMQGKLTRLSSSLSGSSFSMPSSTFSIPALEEKKAKANQESDMLTCQGEVWLEDAVTGYDRKDVGTFSLMKLETPSDPKAFTITIPRPVRNQD